MVTLVTTVPVIPGQILVAATTTHPRPQSLPRPHSQDNANGSKWEAMLGGAGYKAIIISGRLGGACNCPSPQSSPPSSSSS